MPFMTPEYAYQEALRRIRGAEETTALDLSELYYLNQIPRELGHLTSLIAQPRRLLAGWPHLRSERLASTVATSQR